MLDEPSPVREMWSVVRTHLRQEVRAELNLRSEGIETFLPKMAGLRTMGPRAAGRIMPLFPQYLFARFDPHVRLHDVTFTRGVQAVLRVGGGLAVVDEFVIAFLRSRADEYGLIRVGATLRPGEKVVIEDGPFAPLVGVVERILPQQQRVTVLLTAVQTPLRVDVASRSVRSVAHARS